MDQVGSFPVPIFQTTSRKTAGVPGISQFPVDTSSKSPSTTSRWAGAVELVLPSQIMARGQSTCMVRIFLIQYTLWGIPCK